MKSVLRIIIGFVFILSGFVKAVDVVGFSFKLEEYFSPAVFNIAFLENLALPIAIIVVLLELLLGIMLLLRIRLKFTLLALIGLCIFFAFLTFYSAYYNKVTDCGCFGDAVKFTPWQSFFKDMLLLAGLGILWMMYRNHFHLLEKQRPSKYWVFTVFVILVGYIISYGILHEPIIDFRDYKIGTDLKAEKIKIDKNPSEYKTYYSLKNNKTGEILEVNQDDYVNDKKYWDEGSPWIIEKDKTTSKITRQGYDSEISKFRPETAEGNDVTDEILQASKAVLLFSYDPQNADAQVLKRTEAKLQQQKNALVYGISTDPNTFKNIPNAKMDGTAIKTIARSNPFVLILEKGIVTDKKSAQDYLKQ